MPKSIFRVFSFDAFHYYVQTTTFQRRVTCIQNHHTWKPNYSHFSFSNPRYMDHLENMRQDHVHNRYWSDIGQNITIFPDGKIALCRPLDLQPAGILGANTGAVCIEHFGNFDAGADEMTQEQRAAIVQINAVICLKFGLRPTTQQVVYHHWYDTRGKRFSAAAIDSGKVLQLHLQKTCPGTNFFCAPGEQRGNTIASARTNFYPLIAQEMDRLQTLPGQALVPVIRKVKAGLLNVRTGRGTDFAIIRRIPRGVQVQVFDEADGWCRLSSNAEEWVHASFLT